MLENTEGTIKNGEYRETGNIDEEKKTHKHNTICVVHHYTLTNTNNVNKKRILLQTTGGKDKPNIDFIRNRNGHQNKELRT